jgi:hypothetical protein
METLNVIPAIENARLVTILKLALLVRLMPIQPTLLIADASQTSMIIEIRIIFFALIV